jgi:PKD repeat protein/predicted RNA-binding Zn-ribbon protein involved in translation (DUF1610 family)
LDAPREMIYLKKQAKGLGRFGPLAQACALVIVLLFALPPLATSQPPARANSPPDADAGAEVTDRLLNEDVKLNGSLSTDEDISTCTFKWTCTSHTGIVIVDDTKQNASWKVSVEGATVKFELKVTDAEGMEDTATVDVVVAKNTDPKARIGSPVDGAVFVEDADILFDGSTSSDPESRTLTYRWTSNITGQLSTERSFTRPLTDLGWHRITLNVSDPNGGYNAASVSIKVRDPPAPPIAQANVPKSTYNKGEVIEFDGTMSSDPNEGDVLNFTWRTDLGGDRIIGYGPVLETALEEGAHNVTLNVTDSDSLSDEDSVKVTVRNRSPEPMISGPPIVNVSQTGLFSAFATTDPDSDPLSFVWDFGDGYRDVGVNVSHSWTQWGEFVINLTVDDGSALDNTALDTFAVKVNSIPVADFDIDGPAIVGGSTLFRANCSDEDGDRLSYRWDFDDDLIYDTQGLTASHTFEEEGENPVTLEVSDGFAVSTVTITVQATYPNESPIADAGPDLVAPMKEGRGEALLDGSRSYDPDDDADGNGVIDGRERDNLTYRWDLDTAVDSDRDGTADNDIDAKGKTVRFVLKEEGPYTIALNVTDRRGKWAQDLLEVRGDNAPTISSLTSSPSGRALAGGSITFTASVRDTDRGDESKLLVTWEIEGVKKTGTKVTHVFTTIGMKEVAATVSDGFLNTSSTIEISIERLPAPKITSPSNNSEVSGTVKIRGTAAPAGGGIIKTVEISINDGPWFKCSKGTADWKNWYYDWDSAEGIGGKNVVKVRVAVDSGGSPVYSTTQLVLVKGSGGGGGGIDMMIVIPIVVIILFAGVILFFFIRSRGARGVEMPPNGGQLVPGPMPATALSGPSLPVMPLQQDLKIGPPAPIPPQAPKEKTIRIKCPACGGMFAYRDTGERPIHLICDHCGAKGVIDSTAPGVPIAQSPGKAPEGKGKPIMIICPGCSGLFEIAERVDSLKCPFCGAEGDLDEATVKAMDEFFGPVPNMVTLRCPKCSELFEIKEGDKEIACPHCGVRGKI